MATQTRAPTSDFATGGTVGYSSGSTGYTLVNDYPDTADPLTTYVQFGTTANSFIAFGFSAFTVPTGSTINSVQVQYTDEEASTGANTAAGRLRVGGTYYDATTHNPSTTTTSRTDTWTTNPRTGSAWTVADVNGSGTNPLEYFGVIGPDSNPAWRLGSIQVVVDYTASASLTPNRFDNSNTFYASTVGRGAVGLTPARFNNTNTFYAPTVGRGAVTLTVGKYDNSNTFYAPAAKNVSSLTPALLSNSIAFYGPAITQSAPNLRPDLFENSNTFYAATVVPAAIALDQIERFDDVQRWDAVNWDEFYWDSELFYEASVKNVNTLTPARFDNANAFYAATVTPGPVTISATRFDNANTFYATTVTPGAIDLAPPRYDSANAFFDVTVTRGSVDLAPSRYDNVTTFYQATVTPGPVDVLPGRYDNTSTVYQPTVTPGPIDLQPSLVANANAFYAPAITVGPVDVAPQLYVNTNQFFGPELKATYAVFPDLYANSNAFYGPAAQATYALNPARYDNQNTIYAAKITQWVAPQILVNANQFYAADVSPEPWPIYPALLANQSLVYFPSVTADGGASGGEYIFRRRRRM